jgi:hypothetical protein
MIRCCSCYSIWNLVHVPRVRATVQRFISIALQLLQRLELKREVSMSQGFVQSLRDLFQLLSRSMSPIWTVLSSTSALLPTSALCLAAQQP